MRISRQVKQFTRKLWIWGLAVFMVSAVVSPTPVQAGAAESWSQFAKMGQGANIYLGAFSAPKRVVLDSKGNMYVADTSNNRIQKLTAATGEWSAWGTNDGKYGTELGEFSGPQGLAIDKYDNLYVADSSNDRIQKFNAMANKWSEIGHGKGNALGQFMDPKGVAVDGSGNIYVADSGNHRIQKLTPGDLGVWSSIGKNGKGLGEFNNPSAIAIDHDGNLYVADRDNHRIQKLSISKGGPGVDVWSEWISSSGRAGSDLGEFKYPTDVAVDASGNVYVADRDNHRIQKLDVSSGGTGTWSEIGGGPGSGLGEFKNPNGVALDNSGNVYVADTNNHRIQKLAAGSGQWSGWIYNGPVKGTNVGEFSYPSGVAVDKSGNVYVADFDNNRIQKLHDGEWKEFGNGPGTGLGQFDGPTEITVDPSGNVYVADMYNHRIQKMTAAGDWSVVSIGRGDDLGKLEFPRGVAVDPSGNVYVADSYTHRIQKLNVEKEEWEYIGGGKGSNLGEFNEPSGIEVDHSGNVYVADTMNHRIQKLDVSLGNWSAWKKGGNSEAGSGLGEFNEPYSIAIDSNGNLYVADLGNHRIQKLNASTGVWSEWGKSGGRPGGGLGEFNSPLGVAVDEVGNLYVAEFANHRIQKWSSQIVPPDAPTEVKAEIVDGESQATVQFTAPANDGGSGITGYTVISSPDGITATGTSSPITVTGLTYGTAYTFTVVATNIIGSSSPSTASNSVKPTAPIEPTVPSAPTDVKAEVVTGESQATVSFAAPAYSGGSSITGYTVTSNPGGITATGTGSPITVTGLTYGIAYTFTVSAINAIGSSIDSAPSNRVVPMEHVSVPDTPTRVTAAAGNGEATVSFTAPDRDGGSPITGYTVIASPGGRTAFGTGSPITMTGLSNGTTYTFTVIAVNAAGSSASSAPSNAVIPRDSSTNSGNGSGLTTTAPTTPVPEKKGADVLVNGKLLRAGTINMSTVNAQTVSTITIDPNMLEEKLAKEGKSAVVTIFVNSGSDVVIGELDGQMIRNMALQQAIVEIRTDKSVYKLPAQQIDTPSILSQLGSSASLKDMRIQVKVAVPTAPIPGSSVTMVVPPLEFTVRALYQDKKIELNEFKAYVERMLVLPDGVDPNQITTGVVIEKDGALRHVPTKVVQRDGKHYAIINSMTNSIYSVIWNPLTFQDVAQHWAKNAVNDMGSRLVIQGDGEGSLHPDQEMTRAEFAAILIRGLGLREQAGTAVFSDVTPTDWFVDAVGTAQRYGLIQGYEDGNFRPQDKVTREQAMSILARAMTLTGLAAKSSLSNGPSVNDFADAGTISDWAKNAIAECMQSGLISGRNGKQLAPKASITRAEVAMMVQRLLEKSDLI